MKKEIEEYLQDKELYTTGNNYIISHEQLCDLLREYHMYKRSQTEKTPELKYMHVPSNTNSDHSL